MYTDFVSPSLSVAYVSKKKKYNRFVWVCMSSDTAAVRHISSYRSHFAVCIPSTLSISFALWFTTAFTTFNPLGSSIAQQMAHKCAHIIIDKHVVINFTMFHSVWLSLSLAIYAKRQISCDCVCVYSVPNSVAIFHLCREGSVVTTKN